MATQKELDELYMNTAILYSKLSKAKRKQVGAVLVTHQGVTLPGYNGTPSGTPNSCEDDSFNTKPEVLHAELNCLMKSSKEGISVLGSTLYTTLSPCVQCSAMLIQAGVKRVVYGEAYRDVTGLDYLKSSAIIVEQMDLNENLVSETY